MLGKPAGDRATARPAVPRAGLIPVAGLVLLCLLLAGCGGGGGGGAQGQGGGGSRSQGDGDRSLVSIKPTRPIPGTRSGDLPEAVPRLLGDCDRGLREEQWGVVRDKMRSAIQSSQQPQELAIAWHCLAIADTSLGNLEAAADELAQAERLRGALPAGPREDLELLRLRGQMVVQTELGDAAEGRRLLAEAVAVAPDQAATLRADFQQAAAARQATEETSSTAPPSTDVPSTDAPTSSETG
jgi:hypothetical protein